MKKLLAFVLSLSLLLSLNSGLTQTQAADSETVTINNTTRTYNKIWFVSPTGNDTTNDGTKQRPFATYYQAYNYAQAGDCIFFLPGEHFLEKAKKVSTNTETPSSFLMPVTVGVDVIGSGSDTIIHMDSSALTTKYRPVFQGVKGPSMVANMHIKFKGVGKSGQTPSNRAVFLNCFGGTFENMYFENVGTAKSAFSYTLGTVSGAPSVNNCIFDVGTSKISYQNSSPRFTNCLFTVKPEKGNFTTCLTRPINDGDMERNGAERYFDARNVGTGTNPDGSQAHIGVYGGRFAWGGTVSTSGDDAPRPPEDYEGVAAPVEINKTIQLYAKSSIEENAEYTWASNNTAIATVDATGKVTGLSEGYAFITAKNPAANYDYKIKILVTAPVEDIPPEPVLDLTVSDLQSPEQTEDAIQLTWTGSADAAFYEIEYNGITETVNGTEITITGLETDTEYTFTVTACTSEIYGDWSEITVRTAAYTQPEGNLALVAVASSDSLHNSSDYSPNKMNDGDTGTRWTGNVNNTQVYAELDFGRVMKFNQVIVRENGSRIGNYDLQYWDGGQWQTIQSGNGLGRNAVLDFSEVTASKVRIMILSNKTTSAYGIFEFEVYRN